MQMSLMCLLCETSCGLHLLPYGPSVLITHYSESHRHNVFEIDPNRTHRWIEIKKKKKKEKKMSSNTVKLLWPSIKVFGFSNGLEILYIGALHPYLSIPHLSHDWWAVLLC